MSDQHSPCVSVLNRRNFVVAGGGLAAAGVSELLNRDARAAEPADRSRSSLIKPGQTIVFQGDSITDAGRKRDDSAANSQPALGNGYAWLAAAHLLVDRLNDKLRIFNRGINGDQVGQLANRWQSDCLDLKPDVLSILIGVNDYAANKGNHNFTHELEKYTSGYRALIECTKMALPNVKLIICEPFALKVGAVDDSWYPGYDGYRAAAHKIAKSAGATYVPFQAMFDLAVKVAPPERWSADGGHPTSDGAALMARCWLDAVRA